MSIRPPRRSAFPSVLRVSPLLLGLLLAALILAPGCTVVEEAIQNPQAQETASEADCPANEQEYQEEVSGYVADQRNRPSHKAMALSRSRESSCFAMGWSWGHGTEQQAIDRAMRECRTVRARHQEKYNQTYSECELYMVEGQRR